jgi:hypothetical protein
MPRYTLYRAGEKSGKRDITKKVTSAGARVIAARPDLALIDASDTVVEHLRSALPEWRITEEQTAKRPEPRPKVRRPRHR